MFELLSLFLWLKPSHNEILFQNFFQTTTKWTFVARGKFMLISMALWALFVVQVCSKPLL